MSKNPEQVYKSNYKPFPPDVQLAVWLKTDGLCWYCGKQTDMFSAMGTSGEQLKRKFTIDHFISLRSGGTDELGNLVPACWSCNASKNHRSIEQWRDSLRWKSIGRLTQRQIDWFHSHGIEIPEPPNIEFYFESVGLG